MRRPHEADAGLLDAARDGGERHVELDAERGEHVGGARPARRPAVAVLGDLDAGAGGDQRRAGRDIVGAGAVAAGADDVDRAGRNLDAVHARAHHLGGAGDLLHRLAAHAQRHQEGAHLRRRGRARRHLVERGADLVLVERGAARDLLDQLAQFVGGLGRVHGVSQLRRRGARVWRCAGAARGRRARGSWRAARGRARRRCSRDGTARRARGASCAAGP